VGFVAASGGSFTFKYFSASSQTDDTPSTSSTWYYCLDTVSSQVYLYSSRSFTSGTLVKIYTDNSVAGTLKPYQYEFLESGMTNGNKYCLVSFTGSGTSATPDLVQCMRMTYSTSGSATAKLFPLFDPPAYFPSANQGGGSSAITFAITGTQWNPYLYTETNSA
jgi:hypothetical protein